GAGLLAVVGCAADSSPSTSSTTASSSSSAGVSSEVSDETEGPYPGDGSNGVNVLDDSGIVRSDITRSFDTSTTVAPGVPLTINMTLLDADSGFSALAGAAVYLWQCDAEGGYSMYSSGLENENYLRGVQETDGSGTVMFTSVFPGCYQGRWPHVHFEVYSSVADATSSGPIVKTSQLALPEAACNAAYEDSAYDSTRSNLGNISLMSDGIFGDDGGIHQLATVTGSVADGFVANLTIGV
ncbi:MAG: 3,4-dioxygenase subunit beta, partial [Rhodococcus sp. (in: high G+C Gram-positive bacteria)]